MAWGTGGSKDPNKSNENNHFDENYKKNCWVHRRGSKDGNENDGNSKCNDFSENYKNSPNVMA